MIGTWVEQLPGLGVQTNTGVLLFYCFLFSGQALPCQIHAWVMGTQL